LGEIHKIIGGAGTGKTRLIESRLTQARKELRLSHDQIGLCTFTRAGRAELAGRVAESWGVDTEALTTHGWFRTAHSIAYKQCGVDEGSLIEGSEGDDWASEVLGVRVAVASSRANQRREFRGSTCDVNLSLRAWELARQTMRPLGKVVQEWATFGEPSPPLSMALSVVGKYETAKRRQGRMDFTDLVASFAGVRFTTDAVSECEPAGEVPEQLRVLAIDEAQDSSALVDRVCRRLAAGADRVFIVGDPYQSIYGFGGGDYRHFLSWDGVESTMPQSYRCPDKIMRLGESCLRQMRSGYVDRGIAPASHEGSIHRAPTPEDAVRRLDGSRSTLILARCGFALEAYESCLRAKNIPYAWVDKAGASNAKSGYACLWSIEAGKIVHADDWTHAVAITATKDPNGQRLLPHGEKTAWASGKRGEVDWIRPCVEDLVRAGCTEAYAAAILAGRWASCLDTKHRDDGALWRTSAAKYGPEVASNPVVRLSTVHASKGMEADDVILSTVSSWNVERSRQATAERHDEERRVAYVAVTRARHSLTIVDDACRERFEVTA
jgi:DNA helicase-2/ATP-dependent DNA helicase PcrA